MPASTTVTDVTEIDGLFIPPPEPLARGRAAGEPVPVPRHPALGAAIGLTSVFAVARFGLTPEAGVALVAGAVLCVLSAVDIAYRLLPNRIIFPAFLVILVAQVAIAPQDAVQWLLAGPAAAAFLAAPLVVRRDAIGLGDVKLAILLGAIVGWGVFAAIVIGCFAMVPFSLAMLVRDRSLRGATLPFGPFLAVGTLVVLYL